MDCNWNENIGSPSKDITALGRCALEKQANLRTIADICYKEMDEGIKLISVSLVVNSGEIRV